MNLQNLQYFEKLIKLKSYSSVADFFDVYQSTISMGIKRLEKEAGCLLVIHNYRHNKLILTSAGETLHKYSKKIVDQLPLLNNEMKKYQQQLNLELGIPPMVNNTYLPKIAKNLSDKMLLNLDIVDGTSKELINIMKKDGLDIAIVASVIPIELKGFESRILAQDKFKIVTSRQNRLADKKTISLKDLNAEKFIQMSDGFIQSDVINKIKKKYPKSLDVVYRTTDPELIKELVKSNVGISMLFSEEIDATDDLAGINLDCDMVPDVYISLVWRSSSEKSGQVHKLLDTIVNSFK